MNDYGYTVDDYGRTKKVDDTGGKEFDVLFKKENYETGNKEYDEKGSGKKGIKLEKGILDKEQTQVSEPNNLGEKTEQTTYQFGGDAQGETLFRFLAKNTKVEWNLIQYNDNGGKSSQNRECK